MTRPWSAPPSSSRTTTAPPLSAYRLGNARPPGSAKKRRSPSPKRNRRPVAGTVRNMERKWAGAVLGAFASPGCLVMDRNSGNEGGWRARDPMPWYRLKTNPSAVMRRGRDVLIDEGAAVFWNGERLYIDDTRGNGQDSPRAAAAVGIHTTFGEPSNFAWLEGEAAALAEHDAE
ncbi:unnamed protein product, partial [Phaeothamnion confervicola]